MKTICTALILFALAGCATQGPGVWGQPRGGLPLLVPASAPTPPGALLLTPAVVAPATAPVAPAVVPIVSPLPPTLQNDSMPQMVMPMTGGLPVTAIPIGGNLYQPLTGGPPEPGIPLGP